MVQNSIIVAQPGMQHPYSHETAFAIQEGGMLHSYVTSIYYKPRSLLSRTLGLIKPVRQRLLSRQKDGLPNHLVRLHPFGELSYLAAVRIRPFAKRASRIMRWRNQRFDKLVGRTIEQQRPAGIVSYDTCALRAFKAAKRLGILCVLDQSIGHWQTLAQLMWEEAELQPDFADSLPVDLPERFLAQCSEEALLADVIMAGSQYVKDTMVRHGVEPSRVAVIPYGADPERFKPVRRVADGRFRVLFVGQLSQRKGIKYLLEAVKELAIPDLELVMVGGVVGSGAGLGPYRDYFKHIPNVPHREVHTRFQNADLFVYPSLHEGSAIAIFEALASGLPVITTPNSGSVVADGVEGFIVAIRNIEALKERILLLYEQPDLRLTMAQNARRLGEQFSWTAYRRKVGDLLKATLREKSAGLRLTTNAD